MPTAEAQIETTKSSRYLVQLCKHAAAMGGAHGHGPHGHLRGMLSRREVQVQAEWSDAHGTLVFTPWGRCTLWASGNLLTVRVEASNEDSLRQIKEIITNNLDRFSQRDPLQVSWHETEAPGSTPEVVSGGTAPARTGKLAALRGHLNVRTILLAVAGVLVVAVHLGLFGAALASSAWTAWAANGVLAIVLLKVVLVLLGGRTILHRRAAKAHREQPTGEDAKAEHRG